METSILRIKKQEHNCTFCRHMYTDALFEGYCGDKTCKVHGCRVVTDHGCKVITCSNFTPKMNNDQKEKDGKAP